MLPIVAGTVRNTVKLAVMENKWQQKKNSGNPLKKENMSPLERQIQIYKDDMEKMRESSKLADITSKMKAGSALTSEELEYLQRNNPQLYKEYMEIKSEKEAYKRQLESCKTKEDVDKLKMTKMGSLLAEAKSVTNNPNIPKGKKLELVEKILMKTMGIQQVHMKFVESAGYHSLPTEEELAEEAKDKAERGEESAEDIKDGVQDNVQDDVRDNIKDGVQEELGQPPETDYESVKEYIVNYVRENRPNGYGMEYLGDDIIKAKRHK